MKDLDQPSRATLRKYGVRFGAYHIYFPNLLKPAARALAALLWAIKQDTIDLSALSGAQHLAGSGRTSFPVDKTLPRDAYRMLGYRQCGERAVRVDILERLADLIRPALAWREASPGTKPAGAFDGRGFVVTQAMTSLTGSAGEDFASILRALGYRSERRPPLPPKPVVVETVATDAPPVEGAGVAPADVVAEATSELVETSADPTAEIVEQPVSGDPAPSAALLPEVTPLAASEETAVVTETQPEPAVAEVQPELVDVAPEPPSAEATAASAAPAPEAPAATDATAEAVAAPETPATTEVPAELQLVEVWRPGGRSEDRRPRHERHRRHHGPRKEGEQGAAAAGEAGAEGEKREGERRHRHRRGRDFRKGRETAAPAEAAATASAAAPAEGASAPAPEQRGHEPRPDRRERFEGKGKDRDKTRDRDNKREKFGDRQGERREDRGPRDRDRGRDKGRDKRDRESGPALRPYATSASPRDRAADPNSPFAKLAALKDQLAGNRKE
jgi:ATP-dependent RNA helicase SUPV3L1/SUV3